MIIPVFSNNSDRDSLSIETGWIDLSVSEVSYDGKWAIIHQKQNNLLKSFLVNTNTKEKKEISDKKHIDIQENKFLYLDKYKNTLGILDLKSDINQEIGQCKKISSLRDLKAICYIENNTNTFLISKLKNLTQEIVINDIENYFINDEQSYVILLKKTNVYSLYKLDLNTLKQTKIKEIRNNNIQVIWNKDGTQATVILNVYESLFIDLKKEEKQYIRLGDDITNPLNVTVTFLANNDLYISHLLQIDKVIDKDNDFVDIWYSTDKELETKILSETEYRTALKQRIYSQTEKRLIDIERDKKLSSVIINNPGKILVYDPIIYNDYTSYIPKVPLSLYDIDNHKTTLLVDSLPNISKNISYSADGNFISYIVKHELIVHNLLTNQKKVLNQISNPKEIVWNTDSTSIFIINKNAVWKYNLENNKLENLLQLSGADYRINILNRKNNLNSIYQGFGVLPTYADAEVSLLVHIVNLENNENHIYKITKTKKTLLLYKTPNKISQIHWDKNLQTIVFREENYNLPPIVKIINEKTSSNLFENRTPENLYNWRKQKIIHFADKFNVPLKGILYYPKNFDSTKKYPMIIKIYERQFFAANTYYKTSYQANNGFNIPLLNESGYFVFLPDTYVSKEGPGISALNCVVAGINTATKKVDNINKYKLGIIGSSFGGYETNFIVSQTNLFAAAVSGAAINDIVWHYYSYNYDFPKPSYWRFEDGQYQINKSFGLAPDVYSRNNPLYHAHKIKTPVLSFTGTEDKNVPWEHTRHFYIALKRYRVPHIALFYKNNGHVITTPQATKDLTLRIMDWFDYHLKENKEVEWITHSLYSE
jgi:prolyl oligopeptidase PreP (S9A serine peptidase family)